jgi:hypothetical protein
VVFAVKMPPFLLQYFFDCFFSFALFNCIHFLKAVFCFYFVGNKAK